MATEKILNTRIQLKYDSLQNWATANTLLKTGEVAIAYLPPKGDGVVPEPTASIEAPASAVLMKVGPGNFNDLPFVSALAADVYAWAKESELKFSKAGTGNVVSGIEWDATLNGGKGGIKFTTASVATSEGFEQLQKDVDAVEKDIADNRAAWAKDDNTTYTFAETTDGKGIIITPSEGQGKTITFAFLTKAEIEALNYLVAADITTGSANGTIAVEGADVAVKGLGSAAFTDSTAYATADQGAKADAAAVKTEVDAALATKADKSVVDAMYTNSKIDELLAAKQNTIPANTYDTYGSAAQALADANKYTDDKFTEANLGQYTTEQEVKDIVDGVISAAADVETTITGLTELVDYIEKHGGDASAMATDIGTLKGKVEVIEKKPAYEITATQISNWDGEVGAKAAAATAQKTADDYATAHANDYTNTQIDAAIDADVKAAIDAEVERAEAAYVKSITTEVSNFGDNTAMVTVNGTGIHKIAGSDTITVTAAPAAPPKNPGVSAFENPKNLRNNFSP